MPVPEERLYKSERLNRWFAVSSILMTASILWMVYVDYARPWHGYQHGYFVGKAALAHLEYLDAVRQEKTNEIDEARARLKDAKELAGKTSGSTQAALRAELAEADLEFRKVDAPYGRDIQVLQVLRDAHERALGALGPDHPETKEALRIVNEGNERADVLRKDKEKWEERKKNLQKELAELDHDAVVAQKRVNELLQRQESALQKDQQFRGVLTDDGLLGGLPLVSTIINWPLLDFTAPKNTPSRYQVNQLVLPDVRQRLNYLESYTTDRCTTCHVSIYDPDFSQETLARKLETALPGINEALQRMKQPPLEYPVPPVIDANAPIPAGRVTEHWNRLTREQRDAYFAALLGLTNRYLNLGGRKTIDLRQPLLAHPDLDLYVSVDSPHPMNKMGCTVCHEGNPQETDFVLAGHSPPTHEIEERWKDEYYDLVLGVPTMTFETMEHFWDRPMRWPQYSEAGCSKCHEQIADIGKYRGERKGERTNFGRHLFTQLGCVNCHNVESLAGSRRVGPDLTRVASKLKAEFVEPWVNFPQKFRPSTHMPHFFHQENNRAESKNQFDADPLTRTETEVAAVTNYLFKVSKPWTPLKKPDDVSGDAERGRQLFKNVGCLACHANVGEFGESWITRDLMQRERLTEETARFRYKGMTHEERSRYAMEHFVGETDTFLQPEKSHFDPDRPEPIPTFTRFGPELSGIGSKVSFDWLYSWLMQPTHYSPDTKMPSLRHSPDEAADLAAYLLTLKNPEFEQKRFEMNPARTAMADTLLLGLLTAQRSERHSRAILLDEGGELTQMMKSLLEPSLGKEAAYELVTPLTLQEKKLMFLGSKMIGHYGCYACHTIAGFEKTTPPGTDLTPWAEKPVSQLDFAFYDHAFHDMRHEKEEIFGHVYPQDAKELNQWSPGENPKEQITHTHAAFARHKLLNPRIWDREKIKAPYDKLKMPNFYLSEDEVEALTTFLLSRIPSRVSGSLAVDYEKGGAGPIARGRHLTRELNCIACHEAEDNVPAIQQYFRRNVGGKLVFDALNAPPSLRGEGAKLQHQWFHHFLLNVQPLRPWLQVRMPSFNLTVEQATTLVEYFAALSEQDSRTLTKALAPVDEHISKAQEKEAAAVKTDASKTDSPPPGGDWYEQEPLKRSTDVLRQWAVERHLVRPSELDALRSEPDAVRDGHAKVLDRVKFLRDLYDVHYPFVQPPNPLSSEDRFAFGGRFFNDMRCLGCHVLGGMQPGPAKNTDDFVQTYRLDGVRGEGDQATAMLNGAPYKIGSVIDGHTLVSATNILHENGDIETKAVVEGPTADGGTERVMLQAASAPNLSLTYQRLRRDWVVQWMLQPGLIQPGTKMPQNFLKGKSPYEGDERYPGTSGDHLNLLVDYLYDAGAKGTRAPLPKTVAKDASKGFEEEKEFEEE